MNEPAPRIALRHRLDYRFDRPVRLSTHWLRLCPAPNTRANVTAYTLRVGPRTHFLNWLRDPFENHLARLDLPEPIRHFTLDVEILAELQPANPFDFLAERYAVNHPFDYPQQLARDLAPYLRQPAIGPITRAWLARLDGTEAATMERLTALNQHVGTTLATADDDAPGSVDTDAVLDAGTGSPRALAWLLTLALRHYGIAARLVSGYRLTGAAPDYHAALAAWVEAYLPGAGWIGLDPVAGLFTAEQHIPLATAADPLRLRPVIGYREACEETVSEDLEVITLTARGPDWPYTDAQWTAIHATADHVDERLQHRNITLTGGTALEFTRPDHKAAPEWRTGGPGPDTLATARRLARRLRDRLLPGAAICTGQGEWFAGEPAPRWRIHCIARRDGTPVWQDPGLLDVPGRDDSPGREAVLPLANSIAQRLGLAPEDVLPAHEDQLFALWNDRQALEFRPDDSDLATPEARLALARHLDRAHGPATGFVLPLHRDPGSGTWLSGPWPTRRGTVTLLPGEAPMGFRLPLNGLPRTAEGRVEPPPARSPWDSDAPLSAVAGSRRALPGASVMPATALCVERRQGQLHVFLPPLPSSDDFLHLMDAVEGAAAECGVAVHLEGYTPPTDPRLQCLELEPETGTLRITVPPAPDWRQECAWLQAVYDEAERLGLAAWTGDADLPAPAGQRAGRQLGGQTPAHSPFLRDPGLLRSLLLYWQRHPSLSYLFAGPRVGPDGWAPRLDEVSDGHMRELALALERLPHGDCDRPWLADRVLSHLVTDPAGDPRGGEFRLHRLYPAGAGGERLGIVELHAFAMAPHARLAAVESLLLRAIVLRLAVRPETGAPVRWGTALHDRFLLPEVLQRDFDTVLAELGDCGVRLESRWFAPWITWMFPLLADLHAGPVRLRLQPALEPWPVLAEESTGQGSFRFIDPANARFQVHLTGMTPNRHVLLCNGHRVPLQGTDRPGEAVAGIRCKVADPPATLYPGMPPVRALVFDLVDTWSGRTLGGCTYELPDTDAWSPPDVSPIADTATPGYSGSPAATRPAPPGAATAFSARGRLLPESSPGTPPVPSTPSTAPETPYLLDLADPRPGSGL